MNRHILAAVAIICCTASGCEVSSLNSPDLEPAARGPYSVASTNMQVAPEYVDIGDEKMHDYLLGRADESGSRRYITDILKYPESAWVVDVPIPEQQTADGQLYGPASGQTLPVVAFLAFPSKAKQQKNAYAFPYHDARYGVFEDMLDADEKPQFADPDARYPLIILSHGASAHGIYDVSHAQSIASHGFIVAVIIYGDDRTAYPDDPNHHVSFLRPLLTTAILDSILDSDTFGPHVDTGNIGISGHSFGGFTALALAGGPYLGYDATVSDPRIKAAVLAAPWVGHVHEGNDFFAFGPDNSGLGRVTAATIWLYGSKDDVTLASFILPAAKQVSGPRYVVELVDQPHVFEQGSWEDRDNWELLFFSAYLKHDKASLEKLKLGRSMNGGNEDVQHFDYQK